MTQVWSWILTALGATALFVVGRRPVVGWALGVLLVQPLWLVYGIVTRQWGFIASVAIYGGVFGRNWWLATRRSREEVATGEHR